MLKSMCSKIHQNWVKIKSPKPQICNCRELLATAASRWHADDALYPALLLLHCYPLTRINLTGTEAKGLFTTAVRSMGVVTWDSMITCIARVYTQGYQYLRYTGTSLFDTERSTTCS
eukprot:scpid109251/ scgid6823/ 